jgi:hypothetical protein
MSEKKTAETLDWFNTWQYNKHCNVIKTLKGIV